LPNPSDSASYGETSFSAFFLRLPLFSDFAGAMELEMALDGITDDARFRSAAIRSSI